MLCCNVLHSGTPPAFRIMCLRKWTLNIYQQWWQVIFLTWSEPCLGSARPQLQSGLHSLGEQKGWWRIPWQPAPCSAQRRVHLQSKWEMLFVNFTHELQCMVWFSLQTPKISNVLYCCIITPSQLLISYHIMSKTLYIFHSESCL